MNTNTLAHKISAIVFDLDGTLVDIAPDIANAVNAVLSSYGLPVQSIEVVEQFIGDGSQGLISSIYAALGINLSDEQLRRNTSEYLAHHRKTPVVYATLYPGAREALHSLHGSGIRLGVCTNKAEDLAQAVLRHFGIAHYFSTVVGGDTLSIRKPDPEHLLETLRRLGVDSSSAYYVGDSVFDFQCSQRAKVPFFAVNWGTGKDLQVDDSHRLMSLSDLSQLVYDHEK